MNAEANVLEALMDGLACIYMVWLVEDQAA